MDNIPKPFPLLHLPRLPLKEVFSMMTPFELINISMASSKSKVIMKCFLKNDKNMKYRLVVSTSKEPKVSLFGSDTCFDYILTSDQSIHNKMDYAIFQDSLKYDILWVYSENLILDWMKLFKTVKELFSCRCSGVLFLPDSFPEQNKAVVDFMKLETAEIDGCLIRGETENYEDIEYFLNNINVTEHLEIYTKLSDRFQIKRNTPLKGIVIHFGNCLTFNQLLQLDGLDIDIRKSNFTNIELNAFLLSWMASSSHRNLKRIKIPINDFESFETIFDLPHQVIDPKLIRQGKTSDNEIIQLQGGADIKRIDGAIGTIYFVLENDQMMLIMIVSYLFT
ncbi:hypothetical protein CRE_22839 [Caenorhabditis remanei]|uniref:F-box domain-containing protein n=1 Tax=Caenorhabditis remanei TaxID=31234 RepID=E3MHH5_CAERE|nr:hypothetical protein CRE_22839 [Caenorhabditis remanei]